MFHRRRASRREADWQSLQDVAVPLLVLYARVTGSLIAAESVTVKFTGLVPLRPSSPRHRCC